MTPMNSSPYPLEWGSLKLKSKRSLGRLRDRIVAFRSADNNPPDFESISQFFYPYSSEAENFRKQSFSASTVSTIMTNTEPYSSIDLPFPRNQGSEASSLAGSTKNAYSASVYSEHVEDQIASIGHIRSKMSPDSTISNNHRLSVSLTSPIIRPQTPDHHSDDSSLPDLNQYSRSQVNHSPDSAYSSMKHFPDIENSPHSAKESSPGSNLPPLQTKGPTEDIEQLDPILEDDPRSFELVEPPSDTEIAISSYSLEQRAAQMFSRRHLEEIFTDPSSMLKFTSFLRQHRPSSVPMLLYHLDALKALKAIKYSNAIISDLLTPLPNHGFTEIKIQQGINEALEKRARDSFDVLVREDLPAYITHVFIQVVGLTLRQRVTGLMPAHLRDASEGLAEVFCLTDPARPDNPIVFASEEFHRTTQYGVDYTIGRNCRFLQGPNTSKDSLRRLKEALEQSQEVNELLLNYRRDGSPFMNLLTVSPLYDSKGRIRYFIGAQVDVSGLCKDATNLEGLKRLLEREASSSTSQRTAKEDPNGNSQNYFSVQSKEDTVSGDQLDNAFQELSSMLSDAELDITRKCGNKARQYNEDNNGKLPESYTNGKARIDVPDAAEAYSRTSSPTGSIPRKVLTSLFQNYLLVRPFPSLRILFASDALRTPGILQSPFLSRIGGSARVRAELSAAMANGHGVTAKVRWVSGRTGDNEGSARWVHCTPLLGKNGSVGVWMIVVVDEEGYEPLRRFKAAPPVAQDVRRPSMDQLKDIRENQDTKLSTEGVGLEPSRLSVIVDESAENSPL